LAEKYQKLLQEYSRTKAQHAVLKRAVLEEKNRSEALLKELNDREQKLRKLEQEIDVLNFHNKGLTKRIEVLQSESSKFLKLGWGANRNRIDSQDRLEAAILDLQNKIVENETLHRKLEEARNERSSSLEDTLRRNKELEDEKKKLAEELHTSKEIYAASLATTLNQKESLEAEVQAATRVLEALQSTSPDLSKENQRLHDLHQELMQYQKATRHRQLLLNGEAGSMGWASDLPSKIIKELIDGTSIQEADHEIEQLLYGLKGIQEVIEKRLPHLSEQAKHPTLVHAEAKASSGDDWGRKNLNTWLNASGVGFQNFRGVQELRNSCDELFGATAECAGLGASLVHLEGLRTSDAASALEVGLQELIAASRQCAAQVKNKLLPGSSARELVVSVDQFQVAAGSVFGALRNWLSQGTSQNDWLLKALDTQLIGFSIHTGSRLDKLLDLFKRWAIIFSSVDKLTYRAASDSASAAGVRLVLRKQNYIEALRREYPPTCIPYAQSLDLLATTVSSEKAKTQLQSRLDLERERSKNLEILLDTFQVKLEASNSKASELHAQLKALKDFNGSLQEELALKSDLILQLESQCKRKASQSEPVPPQILNSGPNGAANGSSFKLDTISSNAIPEDEKDPPSSSLPSNPTNLFEATDPNVNFLQYLSNEEHRVEKIFKRQYETKLQDLTDQVSLAISSDLRFTQLEIADSQAKRFHDAWSEALDKVSESQAENDALKQQVALLTEELAKTKVTPARRVAL
ncbi:hypothetical protein L0F63_006280, partial [Massospora cicadina]